MRLLLVLVVDCGDPGHPQNGMTQVNDGYTYGNDITFTCNENYVLEGNLLATCQSNGKWSKSVPKCLGKSQGITQRFCCWL